MDGFKYKNVFLIDDSIIDNQINKKILENEKFSEKITLIDNPLKAIQLIRSNIQTEEKLPEIIFLDLRMPEMNGLEFLEDISTVKEIEKVKIYVLTSSLNPLEIKLIKENTMVSKFIGKPLNKQILQEI